MLFFSYEAAAQITGPNLVPNPSFENYSACPDNFTNGIGLAVPWYNPQPSADYFNTCAGSGFSTFGVPQNGFGYQFPRNGNGMAGIYALSYEGGSNQEDCREYLQIQMDSILFGAGCYKIIFYVNLSTSVRFGCNNLGAVISPTPISNPAVCSTLVYTDPILPKQNVIINDTLNWTEISGFYLANGGEQYLTIGNFFEKVNTLHDTIQNIGGYSSYYLIDDVGVFEFIETNTSVEAGNDTTIQYGSSVTIGETADTLSSYHWLPENGLSDPFSATTIATPSQTTTYYLYKTQCHSVVDSVTITVEGNLPDIISFSIYPNPGNGFFTVDYGSNTPLTLSVYNAIGQWVNDYYFPAAPNGQTSLDMRFLADGVYSYVLKGKSDIKSGKLVIAN